MLDTRGGPFDAAASSHRAAASAAGAWPTTATGLPLALRDEDIAQLIDRSVFTIKRWRKLKRLPPRTVGPFTSRDAVLAHLGLIKAA
jgi:hypothetical protein